MFDEFRIAEVSRAPRQSGDQRVMQEYLMHDHRKIQAGATLTLPDGRETMTIILVSEDSQWLN